MIIWRGWGILCILFGGLGVWLMSQLGGDKLAMLGLVLGGIASWFLGVHLNRTVPARRAEAYLSQRRSEVEQAVESGAWAPGGVRPASLEEARASGAATLEAERQQLAGARGGNTLFFIPMQYVGVIMAVIGVIATVKASMS